MIPRAYGPSPGLSRPEYSVNTTSARLFNHNYSPKSTPIQGSELYHPYSPNQQVYYQPACQSTYPDSYQTSYGPAYQPSYEPAYQPNISPLNYYSLPQPQIQSSNGLQLPTTTPDYYQVKPYPVYNSPQPAGSRISISSKGLETVLIAILILVALDLVIIRPHK